MRHMNVLGAPHTLLHSQSALTGLLVSAKEALTSKGPLCAFIARMDGASCEVHCNKPSENCCKADA